MSWHRGFTAIAFLSGLAHPGPTILRGAEFLFENRISDSNPCLPDDLGCRQAHGPIAAEPVALSWPVTQ